MRRARRLAALTLLVCLMAGTLRVSATDELLGTVVDGSLLTDGTEAVGTARPKARWTYLSDGTGSLKILGHRKISLAGSTTAYQSVDKIVVTMYLQRMVDGAWKSLLIAPSATKYNTYFVSSTNTYDVSGGYYYRAYGAHIIVEGDYSEAITSYTNGVWID